MSHPLPRTWPTWLRDLDALCAVYPHFVLAGNVADSYLLPDKDLPVAPEAATAIATMLARSGFRAVLTHSVANGYEILGDNSEEALATVHSVIDQDLEQASGTDVALLANVLQKLASTPHRLALVVTDAARLVNRPAELAPREFELFRLAAGAARTARPTRPEGADRRLYNPTCWLVEREHELPAWFTAGNSGVRTIPIPMPDLAERQAAAAHFLIARVNDKDQRKTLAAALATAGEGLGTTALRDVTVLARDQGLDPDGATEPAQVCDDAVRMYKVGMAESPWRTPDLADRLRGNPENPKEHPDAATILSRRVLGQERAVTKATDILIRAVMGMSGAHTGSAASRPRGVLFFVGPTGVGKTELAKAMTEVVFGTEGAYLRFDMSEFAAEHAGDRLIGAPPGYVGFEGGGELTNAVRARPQRLLLFDEIDKAHNLILDKFLQILEDGRLTDGRGTTVHFSETLIVFTSNIGAYRLTEDGKTPAANFGVGDDYEVIEQAFRREVSDFFTRRLKRPELLNRIGENVVVFDVIRPEVARQIVDVQVGHVLRNVEASTGVVVELTSEAKQTLVTLATANLAFGGRGIGNQIEACLVNPLARALFTNRAGPGQYRTVTDLRDGETGPEVVLA